MTDAARNPDDYCYRHPDRLSFVLCEKCGRTICLECQTHVNGKVLCPDDASRSNVTMLPVNRRPPKRKRVRQPSRLFSWVTDTTPVVTYSLLVLLLLLFIVDLSSQGTVTRYLAVNPTGLIGFPDVLHQPWSLITSAFLPGSLFGLLINGYSTYFLGSQIERLFGHQKLIVLYLVSGFGASVFAFFLNAPLSYSIGAISGLVATTVIVVRRMGGNLIFLYITCAISLVFAFVFGQWEGAIGGALAGIGTTLTYLYDDGSVRHRRSRIILGGLVVLLAGLAVLRVVVIGI